MKLLAAGAIEHEVARVTREAHHLLSHADALRDRIDAARAEGDTIKVDLLYARLAHLARQLTRAQACLVPKGDERYEIAQTVIGYCDEADARERPWLAIDEADAAPPLPEAA